MLRPSMLVATIVVFGCGDSSDPATPGTTEAADTSTPIPTSSSTGTTMQQDDGSSTGTPGSTSTASGGSESTTAAPDQACGLEDLKPGTPDPIVAGVEAMQIPPDIAEILLVSCGCHLADDLTVDGVPDYPDTGGFDMTTWAGFHADHPTLERTYREIAQSYVESEFMPLDNFCNVDGEAMDPTHRATLLAWLAEGAPDGATWVP